MGDWSRRFEQTYQVIVPDDLRAWLDEGLWESPLGAEFCHPLPPDRLLAPSHDELWAGFMPPDLLPLIGNDYGDWLCLRIGPDNEILEVVRWGHGGGDWRPFGATLSEALLFDAALHVAKGPQLPFAEELAPDRCFAAAEWAQRQLGAARWPLRFWEDEQRERWRRRPTELYESLLSAGLCVVGASAELALAALQSPIRELGTPEVAAAVDRPWSPDFTQWMLDARQLPDDVRDKLADAWKIPADELGGQDWAEAERHASRILQQRSDLGWAGDIAGWAAERAGDTKLATQRYLRVSRASVYTDDSIRFRTQWYPARFAKFSIFRLHALLQEQPAPGVSDDAYVAVALECSAATLRQQIADFWRGEAAEAENQGRAKEACRALLAAGWDVGLEEFSAYRDLVRRFETAATKADMTALAAVARAHARVLLL